MSILYNIVILALLAMNGVLSYLPHRSVGGSMKSFSHRLVPEMRHSIEDTDSAVNDPAVEELQSPPEIQEQIPNTLLDPRLVGEILGENIEIIKADYDQQKEDEEIVEKSVMLLKLLEDPHLSQLPIVFIEEADTDREHTDGLFNPLDKRSGRYYRRYPWKRQNTRYRPYEADTRYTCVPSRDEVIKLLVGLHESHNGNDQKTVNFCNRKRPAKNVFANIRFLG